MEHVNSILCLCDAIESISDEILTKSVIIEEMAINNDVSGIDVQALEIASRARQVKYITEAVSGKVRKYDDIPAIFTLFDKTNHE